jgi:hypothetical protein
VLADFYSTREFTEEIRGQSFKLSVHENRELHDDPMPLPQDCFTFYCCGIGVAENRNQNSVLRVRVFATS